MNHDEKTTRQAMDLRAIEQQAQEYFAQGRLRDSAECFQRLNRYLPERLDLQARVGYLALLANDLDAAVNQLAQVINQGLRSRQILGHLAEACYRQGRLGSAAYCYQRLGREGLAGTLAVMGELEVYRTAQTQTSAEVAWLTDSPLPVIAAQGQWPAMRTWCSTPGRGIRYWTPGLQLKPECGWAGGNNGHSLAGYRHW